MRDLSASRHTPSLIFLYTLGAVLSKNVAMRYPLSTERRFIDCPQIEWLAERSPAYFCLLRNAAR